MIEERHLERSMPSLTASSPPEQRGELSRLLLAGPEARAFRDQLNRLSGELGKLEDAAPPSDLSASVLGALRIPAGPEPSQIRGRAWYAAPAFRYAAAFVGGLLASALLFGSGARHAAGPDVSQLVGTIGGHDAAGRGSPIDRVKVNLAQVTGAMSSYQVDGQLVVELDLRANQPIEVVVTDAGQTVHFSLGSQPDAAPERVYGCCPVLRTPRLGSSSSCTGAGSSFTKTSSGAPWGAIGEDFQGPNQLSDD